MELELRRGGLAARVDTLGAELVSCRREGGPEYIWTGDPAYWAGRNPLLFPVVGNLRDGKVMFGGRAYEMARHGFARRRQFALEGRGDAYYQGQSWCFELDPDKAVETVNRLINPYTRDLTLEDMDILRADSYYFDY